MEIKKTDKKILCAIYTRVSTTEGMAQEFSSLDNQRESGESYIQSQKSEGWTLCSERYDDGGFTGANTERPALQRLMEDIKKGAINCVVVYKVDRLSRSLLDFSQLLQFFDEHQVTFVSVTQHFNTNTSMGRLTLNILLSFAQFEREIISERTRDKMGAAKKKGRFVGGRPALGYNLDTINHKLVINPAEAKIVKEIFDLYLEKQSLLEVAKTLIDKNYKTKEHASAKGRKFGGIKFKNTSVQHIIKNILYTGKVKFQNELFDGQHEGIIPLQVYEKAQTILNNNRHERRSTKNEPISGLLNNLLRCTSCNSPMFAIYTKKGNCKYHYYLCVNAQKRGYRSCPTRLLNAENTENEVIDCLRKILDDDNALKNILNAVNQGGASEKLITISKLKEAFLINSPLWKELFPQEKRRFLKTLLKQIDYDATKENLSLTLNETGLKFLCTGVSFDLKKEEK
jgi:site-specific DNA recombinase